ncbi:alkaline phosphatase family protein [Verrucomicrobiaceae bacterium N1E253]|uniref:Alkaline phosphatase family protein n=1 Tax=Oceaniferula marina TaxID=2748318 RepID=A0A851GHD5_9BACT|nr:nucleotide pyrophosphatase/phosphodiesterase family protein [Oceaniferula marina]NWK54010.1 alkaline phosphatase family protein [Oceaniferula marina]
MNRVAVINVVGLTKGLIGEHTPAISAFAGRGDISSFPPAFPAVTCTAQSSYVTGRSVASHGIVGNGWYDREAAEVKFWKQSNHIVRGEKLWDELRREYPGFTCAKMFWWYNMYASVDWSVTPRPMYPADGRKVFDVHTQPMGMREEIKSALGEFPFPSFWGPASGIASSRWIAESAKWVENKHQPTLNLVYLPHLDYCLQKDGPNSPGLAGELQAIDEVVGDLISFFQSRDIEVMLLSEYGISPVNRPVHINREFRKRGWIQVKDELGRETLDAGGSKAFAVADHQVAHIYINDPSIREEVLDCLKQIDGVEEVRMPEQWFPEGSGRERAGDLIAVADHDAWFTYYYWLDDALAPDFARCVDIHRKPGYDPVELFLDPDIRLPKLKIARFLLRKKLGFRTLLDVIPLDAGLVRGSHGRDRVPRDEQPVLISQGHANVERAEEVYQRIKQAVVGEAGV